VQYKVKPSFLSFSKLAIIVIVAFWITIISVYKPWRKNQIVNDVVSYYGYLPAAFVEKDITLKFTNEWRWELFVKYWPETAPNGGKVLKTTMGVAILYAPFFLTAHILAPIMHYPQDGYSLPYQFCLLMSCLVSLITGMVFLRKLLLSFFTEKITAITMISVFFATNLLWYSTFDGLMSHGYLFTLTTIFIYLIVKWHEQPRFKIAVLIGLTGGFITLIRPTMFACFLVFALYDVYNKQSFLMKLQLLKNHFRSLLIIIVCFVLMLLPQLIYWKYVTDQWLFFSYIGERFYFNRPHIMEGLFGFRHGWLIYTPIMIFSIFGVFFLKKELKPFFFSIAILLPLLVYVFFSWWAWWYGGAFGLRAFVDFYGLFALPMASLYKQVFEEGKRIFRIMMTAIISLFTCLNLWQSWQFYNGYLHHDSMTREAYIEGFFAVEQKDRWFEELDEPDYNRARAGLPEAYSDQEIKEIKSTDVISFKGSNTKVITCEISPNGEITSSRYRMSKREMFSLIKMEGNNYGIKTSDGKYISVDPDSGKLEAKNDNCGEWEMFELVYLGNNKIALKAHNNKYVAVTAHQPNYLYAVSDKVTKWTKFRIFIN
jgi:hypothetical protein